MDTGASAHWGADPLHANMAQVRPFKTPAAMHVSLQRRHWDWDSGYPSPPWVWKHQARVHKAGKALKLAWVSLLSAIVSP